MAVANYIFNEVLVGTVNGVNKTFTSLYPIDSIEDMRIGGADYTTFSFSGNTIILDDAPTINTGAPSIDYFRTGVAPAVTPSQKTFLSLVNDIYEDVGQDNSSYQYPISMVRRYVREAIPLHLNQKVNPIRKIGTYSFNKAIDSWAIAYSATEIDVGTMPTYTPASGRLILNQSTLVSYNTLNGSKFSSLSGLDVVYDANMKITIAYAIPVGVKKISEVIVDGVLINSVDYREYTANKDNCFAVYDGFLFLPRTVRPVIVTVNYTKDNVDAIEDNDIIDFEANYMDVLRYDVEVKLFNFREDSRLQNTLFLYDKAFKRYKAYIGTQVDSVNRIMRSNAYKQFSGNSRLYKRR